MAGIFGGESIRVHLVIVLLCLCYCAMARVGEAPENFRARFWRVVTWRMLGGPVFGPLTINQ